MVKGTRELLEWPYIIVYKVFDERERRAISRVSGVSIALQVPASFCIQLHSGCAIAAAQRIEKTRIKLAFPGAAGKD